MYVYIYAAISIYTYIENSNFRLLAANGKWKMEICFLGRQMVGIR